MSNLNGTVVTWLGHATVLVQTAKGTNILIGVNPTSVSPAASVLGSLPAYVETMYH